MKNLLKLVISFFIVIFIVTPLIAAKADFDFSIPIQLLHIPDKITHKSFKILVFNKTGGVIASHSTAKTPIMKNFSSELVTRALFNVNPGKNRLNANSYSIYLYLYLNNSSNKVLFKRSQLISKGCPLDESKTYKESPITGNI